ncbi:hypothetical protein 2 [Hubei lepidoptera virus 2]|uniref:Uncharacterized protein n=1 Tax=Hubei lepidoptera virus 2 TaxID=1922904 RepID=A0A1L3KMN7_9RHAB|nr:hypothetical protein 2 [Hubei lepidoptera virus 2]APG78680.1 hypothetical protein 2 [Hubei lepidoptera virus 2]
MNTFRRINFDKEKKEAREQNWNINLPKAALEQAQEELGTDSDDSAEEEDPGEPKDPWNSVLTQNPVMSEVNRDRQFGSSDIERESAFSHHENIDDYDEEGHAEDLIQSGDVNQIVKKALETSTPPVKRLGERKIQVNLQFMQSPPMMEKMKDIIHEVIKAYTTVPGRVEVSASDDGIYIFNATNPYLSPDSDSDPLSSERPYPKPKEKPAPQQVQRQFLPLEANTSTLTDVEIMIKKGVNFQGKYPGLPKCIVRYGRWGITEQSVQLALKENPNLSVNETIRYCMRQAGTLKKFSGLYKF